ncbi:recombination-associated protein RdgC [Geoalkalibacter subterraneus]|uniref:Uncharacterized protein n=1 Tax=Geoalkalibacter subterraneus TaxID=483547 RepID=A0A0B5FJA8_9BACT|nr:recombination-associated protein RdgC [Geoalkalibacter subterraneus]AJF08257.1 hypothetical protein GSUB_17400 [Geoalkalibacter subterraneus]
MGLLSNTTNLKQYRIIDGQLSRESLGFVQEKLQRNAFIPIEQTQEEISCGWTILGSLDKNDFGNINDWQRGNYLCFTLRIDQRKVPASTLKRHCEKEYEKFLQNNQGFKRVPKTEKEAIRERVRLNLLSKTLPATKGIDVVINLDRQDLFVTSLTDKDCDLVEKAFQETFGGICRLRVTPPLEMAMEIAPENLQHNLKVLNRASTDAIVEQIKENVWLGQGFLLWLLHRTIESDSRYRLNTPGPLLRDGEYVAYLNNRLTLTGSAEGGTQKVALSGPQSGFQEARIALHGGKVLSSATVYLEEQENLWKYTLKSDSFHVASLKCPTVKLEKDVDDAEAEEHALFYERMHLIESFLQLHKSLFREFLIQRLDENKWTDLEMKLENFLENGPLLEDAI